MEKFIIKDPSENSKVVEVVLKYLAKNNSNILLLIGDLGAGKTTFTYSLASKLGTLSQVSSPTFVIQKIYNLKSNDTPFKKIYHLDLYRLNSDEEILDMGLFEDIKNPNNLYIIEWPEKIMDTFKNPVVMKIKAINENTREFEIVGY